MKKSLFPIAVFLLGLLAGCEKVTTPVAPEVKPEFSPLEKSVLQVSQAFGLRLFQELDRTTPGQNLFISPFSLSDALAMTANGAAGETRQAILNTLGVPDFSPDELNGIYSRLLQVLPAVDPKVTFLPANSLWYDRVRFALNPAFAETLQKYYFARVIGLDFQRSEAVEAINGWVQDATRGKIPRLLDEIDPRERLFLINALYFQGFWQIPFDPEKTSTENFYRADGSTVSCQMMHRQGEFSVAFLDSLLAVDLPYGNGAFSMTIVLPAEGVSLQSVVAQLNEDRLKAWLAALASREIVLGLPRFRFRNQLHLNDPLSHMGMAIAFDPMRADFSPMQQPGPAAGEKLVVTRVLQNTFVQVDEKGTEAAAVTGIGIGVTSVPPQVTANRPFLLLIREHFAGTILFIGKVEEPVWEE